MANVAWMTWLASRLGQIDGVVGVMLGGSRARGEHSPDSDYDIGVYYRQPLDTDALLSLAQRLAGPEATVSQPGDWGPWVDGGAWLRIDDAAVDWIYRDINRVEASWTSAQRGEFDFHAQIGHPLGVPDFAYAGEVALGVVLHDPAGRLGLLQRQAELYPSALADAVVERLWEADFLLGGLSKSVRRADPVWLGGCLFRVVMLCVHAVHSRAGRWLINEKGAVASAENLSTAPPNFAARARALLGHPGQTVAEVGRTLEAAHTLLHETRTACETAR